jgi:hypothetical protein
MSTENINEEVVSKNFIEQIIDEDLATGKCNKDIITRFPPEPNGYLHIGHAKSILLNYGLAKKYNGKFNLRFDDTNPTKEKTEFVESIKKDVEWIGGKFEDRLFFASDYFEQMYEQNEAFKNAVDTIYEVYKKGEDVYLQCWCKPLRCHGEVIRDFLQKKLIKETRLASRK